MGAPVPGDSEDPGAEGDTADSACAPLPFYADADGDGFGDPLVATLACTQPVGMTSDATDCDDADPAVHPNADESDCASAVDANCDGSVLFADADGDGWAACEECDDADALRNPGQVEVCDGARDEDCDGLLDDADDHVLSPPIWYRDADTDGYGNDALVVSMCQQPIGFSGVGGDCDDADPWRSPGRVEVCDLEDLDEDCSGVADDADMGTLPASFSSFAMDSDGDGYGNPARLVTQCDPPADYVTDATDCDDTDAARSPGLAETCDGADNDCDSLVDDDDASLSGAPSFFADVDGDGWGDPATAVSACTAPTDFVANDDDCDDADPAIPDASGICGSATALADTAGVDTGTVDTGAAAPASTATRFLVLGDTGDGSLNQYAVALGMEAVCAASGCDFALLVGDNFYPGGVTSTGDAQWTDAFEAPYAGLDLQFWAVMGNHDWDHSFDTTLLDAQVDYTALSAKWYMPADYYARVEGDVTFYGIDTQMITVGSGAAQETWLPTERAASATTWNLLFGHHPYLSNGPHGDASGDWQSFFDTYGCGQYDAYFAGHDHNLQWLEDSCGTALFISGAGHSTYPLFGSNPTWFEAQSLGFLWVEIAGRTLTGVFYDEDGIELFRQTMTK